MSTEKINRGILLAMVALVTIAYIALYDHASPDFRLYVPLCVAALFGTADPRCGELAQAPEALNRKFWDAAGVI